MKLTQEIAAKLPMQTVGVLAMHKLGLNIRELMSQPTYARHRALLKAYGWDIHQDVLNIEKRS